MTILRAALVCLAVLVPASALAQPAAPRDRSAGLGMLGSNREPIKIDADRLDVFDRENRAVFAGNVVAVQGETTMKCNTLTVSYEPRSGSGGRPAALTAPAAGENPIRRIDCQGPVTIVSKTQVATGDNAIFDRVANRILLTGNATLSDGPNLTRGERIIYDLNSGVANVETAPGGRVRAMFVPGNGTDAAPSQGKPPEQKPSDQKPKRAAP